MPGIAKSQPTSGTDDFMITFMRNFFKSKIGLGITLGFLALIAFAFASSDVAGNATFGGIAGGDRVAVVGDDRIDAVELSRMTTSAVSQIRRENQTITMPAFVEQGGLDEVLDQLIERYAIGGFAKEYGLRAGDNLINSEILSIPAFNGPDGTFSQDVYQIALQQQGLSDAMVREDLASSLLAQQVLSPSLAGANFPDKFAMRYAALLKERRKGAFAFIPSAAFAPEGDPSAEQLGNFYDEKKARYIRPERRTIRYASFGIGSLDARVDPTSEEIAARYERDAAQYSARETRTLTQLIVPTQAAANALRDRVAAGENFANVAREAGFSTTQIGPIEREQFASSTNADVATAVFGANQGGVAEPRRGPLGWHLVRVDNVSVVAAQSLAAATPDIREQLTIEKRAAALADLSARTEEQIDSGTPLAEVADELGIQINTSPELTADGRVYGDPSRGVPEQLRPTLETVFQMEEGEPQLAEIVPGVNFIIFEASEISPSAAAPLAEITEEVTLAWRLSEGSRLAKEAAERIMERLSEDTELNAAVAQEEAQLPQPQPVDLNRQDLVTNQGQQVPPPLVLMFSMAEGTVKRLEATSDLGWFIVNLNEISTDEVSIDDPLVAAAQQQLRNTISEEYSAQLSAAMRNEIGVERNDASIEAVRKQLLGET
ncbi:MAG: SurA N-terminal domain-containing protein [Erythrobacter sp.]